MSSSQVVSAAPEYPRVTLGADVAVLEGGGDQPAGPADDEVGQGAAQACAVDPAGRVGLDRRCPGGPGEGGVHPGDERLDVLIDAHRGARVHGRAAAAAGLGDARREQQPAGEVLHIDGGQSAGH